MLTICMYLSQRATETSRGDYVLMICMYLSQHATEMSASDQVFMICVYLSQRATETSASDHEDLYVLVRTSDWNWCEWPRFYTYCCNIRTCSVSSCVKFESILGSVDVHGGHNDLPFHRGTCSLLSNPICKNNIKCIGASYCQNVLGD